MRCAVKAGSVSRLLVSEKTRTSLMQPFRATFGGSSFRAITVAIALASAGFAPAYAQLSSATVTGTVRDPANGVIGNAALVLRNVATSVERRAVSNSTGDYSFTNVPPGQYVIEASAPGFKTARISEFQLAVSQTATIDITLQIGQTEQSVDVRAEATQVEAATSELGAVVSTKQVNELPLNGRNFTQLLSLTPGATPISVSQNSSGFGSAETQGSAFTFPAINGQTNRSNFFMLDGLNDQGALTSTYAVAPIIDTIQEFKVVSHNDEAQYGGVMGGIVNVVTKSGTNQPHGSLFEFVRNDFFDARSTFLPHVTAFKQNQFGGTFGAPLWIPKIYNGKNKTFIYLGAEGFTYTQAANALFRVPTPAELSGDLSDVPTQIFNPFSTRPDPAKPGSFIRDAFPGNQLPSSLISAAAVNYAKAILPSPTVIAGQSYYNALDPTPLQQNQQNYVARIDETIGTKDNIWFRYNGLQFTTTSSGGFPGLTNTTQQPASDYGISWVHTFSPTLILQAQYGKAYNANLSATSFTKNSASLYSLYGFADSFGGEFLNGHTYVPSVQVANYWSGGESASLNSPSTDTHQWKADVTKIIGSHSLRFGGEWDQSFLESINTSANVSFAPQETGNPENSAQPGSALASYLLNVPDGGGRRNVDETLRPGGVMDFYAQDQWKFSSNLTINYGLRYDLTLQPPYGLPRTVGKQGGIETGEVNFNNGTYIVQVLPPACNVRGFAPCIPGNGTLPANVVVSPNGKIYHNTYTNWGPRLGLAYRLNNGTAIRAGFGIFYDNWASVTQTAQNYEGAWPDIGQELANNLNVPSATTPIPAVTGQNPFGTTNGFFPAATPFNQVQWFNDPLKKNPYSEQWNIGVEHQFGVSTVVSLNYVGSESHRLDVGGYYNTALTPGPGNPQNDAPYPYIHPTYYDRGIGNGNYNSLQFNIDKRFTKGLAYQVSYTWSKAIDEAASGWYGVEGGVPQNPYNVRADRSVSAFNIPQLLTFNVVYNLPIGTGGAFSTHNKVVDYIIGNWQVNSIFTARSGQPYYVTVDGDVANTGNTGYEHANLVGNPNLSNPTRAKWFNTAAFAIPATYSFGNEGRDILKSDRFINLDFSMFRQFPVRENMHFELRGEAFNVFNHPVYGVPNHDISTPSTFGTVTGLANTPRQLQIAAKFIF
jgi:hypothetical protein